MDAWRFLTSRARVLIRIAREPGARFDRPAVLRLRDVMLRPPAAREDQLRWRDD
jgi:hypothetical protein